MEVRYKDSNLGHTIMSEKTGSANKVKDIYKRGVVWVLRGLVTCCWHAG
jgi:hypothetical protein